MTPAQFQKLLAAFNLPLLFNELGWDNPTLSPQTVTAHGADFTLTQIAQKRGVAVFRCSPDATGKVPPHPVRHKIEQEARKLAHEHLLIFADADETMLTWLWVQRSPGQPTSTRTHVWHQGQSGESLRQKLEQIVWSLEEEEAITLTDVITGLRKAFDRDRISKSFYEKFKAQHEAFADFITGLKETADQSWYASLMLNRLMFVYFIQKKGFLDGDADYLQNRLRQLQSTAGKDQFHGFYRQFLRRLFHEGLGAPKPREAKLHALIGDVPYLNGGLFDVHELESANPGIDVPDEAFEKLFQFFDQWDWHLDDRPLRSGSEINPDVLGYIFEKYINQKQMGAYYTKEDITEYISKNTVIPHLLEQARERCKVAFDGETSVWHLLQADPDRYLYPAMKTGVIVEAASSRFSPDTPQDATSTIIPETDLPDFVQTGMKDPKARMFDKRYNLGEANFTTPSGERGTLPTETWREYVERRTRCLAVRDKLTRGEVKSADDLITLNLDIRQFMHDVVDTATSPDLLRALWQAIVGRVPEKSHEKFHHGITILDPTCGSGAFLFAALNVLHPLYAACLDRMESFVEDARKLGKPGEADFVKVLNEVKKHPSSDYYIYKNIILHNLFGVDIMPEAVEICKLRLFLKLVSQVDTGRELEPLPDIDFNIRAGNTLVGYATEKQFDDSRINSFEFNLEHRKRIKADLADLADLFDRFREQQTVKGGKITPDDKQQLRSKLRGLSGELDSYLARDYGIDPDEREVFAKWRASHQPFHWFAEFYGVMCEGGFDVVIGNPPYKDLKSGANYQLKGFTTLSTKNLYPLLLERGFALTASTGRLGWIVPVSSISTEGYLPLQKLVFQRSGHFSSYDDRPARLFDGLEHIQLTIHLIKAPIRKSPIWHVTKCYRWNALERQHLFSCIEYEAVDSSFLPGTLPKLSSKREHALLDKIWCDGRNLRLQTQRGGQYIAHYSRKVHNFLQALDFIPEVFDGTDKLRPPSELKGLSFSKQTHAQVVFCALNSTLFRWWINVFTDCRHVNKRETEGFRLDLSRIGKNTSIWADLAGSLSKSLKATSEYRKMKFKHDQLRVQCIIPKKSKPIIDEIDMELGTHYGFTDEETDFIINYDIKYRMGGTDNET